MDSKLWWLSGLVAVITIIATVLVGGMNIGNVEAVVNQHEFRLNEIDSRNRTLDERTQTMEVTSQQIATDLSWIKLTLMELRREVKNNGKQNEHD
jgi:hypothetical protein